MSDEMIYRGESFALPILDRHTYAPVGCCMYCGSTDGLSDEHIVPYGLGGNLVLPDSSCPPCAKVTSQFELTVLRGPLRSVRVFRGIQSRRKHRDAPTMLPLLVKIDGAWTSRELPHDEYPIISQFLLLNPPGFFSPEDYEGDISVRGHAAFGWGPRPEEVAKRLGATDLRITQTYAPGHFARMIAKIAYGMAVATGRIDLDIGRPELVAAIRGEATGIGHWVGLLDEPWERSSDHLLHRVAIIEDRDRGLLLGRVQILSDSGTPTYTVVIAPLDAPYVRRSPSC